MTLKVYTDGGAKGNPGPAAIGMVFYACPAKPKGRSGTEDKKIFSYREDIGVATNNVAEYKALIAALTKIKNKISKIKDTYQISKIKFFSDSKLLVNQVNGFYRVKNSKIREFILKIRILEQEILTNLPAVRQLSYHLIPREENKVADRLVKSELT